VELNRWQTAKGLAVTSMIVACFVFTSLPREVVALTGAGVLLMSRKLHSRNMLGWWTGSCWCCSWDCSWSITPCRKPGCRRA